MAKDEIYLIQYEDLALPSDSLTIGMLRQRHAGLFAGPTPFDKVPFFESSVESRRFLALVSQMVKDERLVLATMFAEETGTNGPDCHVAHVRQRLVDSYIKVGLAAGQHEAEELARRVDAIGRSLSQKRPSRS